MSASDELANYFKFLWNDTAGLVYLPTRDRENNWRKFFFRWPDHLPNIIKSVQLWSAEGKEVFVSPAIYKQSAYDEKSVAKEHVLGSHVLYADFDGNAPPEWPAEPSDERPTPSLRVRSSTSDRQHAYWKLDRLEENIEAIETKNRSLAYLLDADKSGWDISQLLRPPGTINHGYGKEERKGKTYEVRTEDTTGLSYELSFFDPRPIFGGKLDELSIPPQSRLLVEFWHEAIFLKSSTSVSFDRSTMFLPEHAPMRLWKLDTLVQRRGLMMRQFTLSCKTLIPDWESMSIVVTDIYAFLRLLNEPDENTLMV